MVGDLKSFLEKAEKQWFSVFYAGRKTRLRSRDGAPLMLLPERFASGHKIRRFFRLYWGERLAKQMVKNLPLTKRCGKLMVIAYDPGPMSTQVRSVQVLCHNRGDLTVLTRLTGGPEGGIYVVHRLRRGKSGKYDIVRRAGPSYDYRYYRAREHMRLARHK